MHINTNLKKLELDCFGTLDCYMKKMSLYVYHTPYTYN